MAQLSFGNKNHSDPKGHGNTTCPINIEIMLGQAVPPIFLRGRGEPLLGAGPVVPIRPSTNTTLQLGPIAVLVVG